MYFGFQKVSIAYGKNTVLEDVSMEFQKGTITTIIGPNGCGKSSLLKTVPRTVTPVRGAVLFQEYPSWSALLGIALILTAIVLLSTGSKNCRS